MDNIENKRNEWKRIPKHIGIIPDGNRRWAKQRGLEKQMGYEFGIEPGFKLYEMCRQLGIEELTLYGFTVDNTKRPAIQKQAFQKACVDAVEILAEKDAELLVVGDSNSSCFPKELIPYRIRRKFGDGGIRVNFLVNYGWDWDLNYPSGIASKDISRIDLILRWGGHCRLSGFLPVQSVYSDFYTLPELWPDFEENQFYRALDWYQRQDITLGG